MPEQSKNFLPISELNEVESWAWIPGYESAYEVSSLGRVRSWLCQGHPEKRRDSPAVLSQFQSRSGRYRSVSLGRFGRTPAKLTPMVHHLVLVAFVGSCPAGLEALHLNNDRFDNRLENLAWGTHAENMRQRDQDGRNPTLGERNPNARLNPEAVREVRRLWAASIPQSQIAERFGLRSRSHVSSIVNRRSWSHVP